MTSTGKDSGEHPLVTACREATEETGIRARAGKRLDTEHYDTADGPKAVEFWAMHGADPLGPGYRHALSARRAAFRAKQGITDTRTSSARPWALAPTHSR